LAEHRFGLDLHYITYFPAVFLLASLFGTAEGIYATVASVLLGINPLAPGAIANLSTDNKVSIVFLVVSGSVLSIVAGALRARTERLHHALELLRSTRLKVAEEQRRLHEATTRLDTVVTSADEAITSIDIHGTLTSWNKGAERVFGYTAGEMIGQRFRKLLPSGLTADAEASEILARLHRGETVEKANVQRVTKDGRTVRVNLTVTPIQDPQAILSGPQRLLAISRNISGCRMISFACMRPVRASIQCLHPLTKQSSVRTSMAS